MEREEYRKLREYERSYWWHVGRRDLLAGMLAWGVTRDPERRAVDVGCGTGRNFELLAPWGRFVGTEVTPDAWADGERPARPVLLARGDRLPFASGSVGLCTFFDVLEHVESEDAFLREVHRILSPGGVVFASVPAYMFLWSDHDVSLHHYRRYVRSSLRAVLERNGLVPFRLTYAMACITPFVAAYRLLARVLPGRRDATSSYVPTPGALNSLLTATLRAEGRILTRSDLPFGTSLLVLARKAER